ncbi:MAG TPA: galactose-1-phosphate uridylyltransferase [Acidobacteriota bacterium]|nr:galactose-1-phosphate uridylyltransferase [Acidobacteriota bacterium]
MKTTWEQRWHPLREEWVIIAAHRQDRPWVGAQVEGAVQKAPEYDPDCFLCPGNLRISGERNPAYSAAFVFDNDHPCVGGQAPDPAPPPGIYRNRPAHGAARVACYTPSHNESLAQLPADRIAHLLSVLRDQTVELSRLPGISHVLIFENKGEVVGVSNPHPHCQIYATNFVFKTIETEARVSERHWRRNGRTLMQSILDAEFEDGRRIICENRSAVAFLPYFARYAYEVFVAPVKSHPSLASVGDGELSDLAVALKDTLVRFDNLWRMPFPYVMTFHQAPIGEGSDRGFHFHIELHPPLRKPGLLKFLAGPEIGGGNFLSDTSPEEKAAELKRQSQVHYLQKEGGR